MANQNIPEALSAALAGDYDLIRELGEGGMAVVYLATDLKHNRRVAIKVLKSDLAAVVGEERFLDEIRTTANLQHPNILPLFDSGAVDGLLFYAMPYVEGETLREKLKREVQLPVEEAVDLARKIASALDYAHEKGIVHRDIKPANILLSSGEPLIADFGIALAVSQANDGRRTETGLSLGTPHYMSPEQAAGDRSLDPRSDIYALGCILQEMLTGEPPFSGANAQAVLARILTTRPTPVTTLRPTVPPHVESVISRSLEKLPADRFRTAKDVRMALVDPDFRHTVTERTAGTGSVPTQTRVVRSGVRPAVAAGIGAVALLVGVVGGSALLGSGEEPAGGYDGPSLRTTLDASAFLGVEWPRNHVLISHDGSQMAWGGGNQLLLRGPMDERFRVLVEPDRLLEKDFSPDGDWIAYVSGDGLWRVPVSGGAPRRILNDDVFSSYTDIDWGPGGMITMVASDTEGWGLFRVADTGGEPELLLREPADVGIATPFVLPDGSGTLATAVFGADPLPHVVLHLPGEDSLRSLIPGALDPSYVEAGYLVFANQEGDLLAQRFDLESHTLEGDAKFVLAGLRKRGAWARYDVSSNGTLVFGTGVADSPLGAELELVEVGLDGSRVPLDVRPRDIFDQSWSPDGRRVAWRGTDPDDPDPDADWIWVYDVLLGNRPAPLAVTGAVSEPVWSPNGETVAFAMREEGEGDMWTIWTARPGSTQPDSIGTFSTRVSVDDWPSDSLLIVWADDPQRLLTLTLSGDTAQYYTPDAWVSAAQVSPDGDWVAYDSSPVGAFEWSIYIRPYPDPGPEIRVSEGLGEFPRWSPDGRTVYFTRGRSFNPSGFPEWTISAVDLELGPTPSVVRQRDVATVQSDWFDLHPDGDRFLTTAPVGTTIADAANARPVGFHVIHNWFAELERIFDDGDGR